MSLAERIYHYIRGQLIKVCLCYCNDAYLRYMELEVFHFFEAPLQSSLYANVGTSVQIVSLKQKLASFTLNVCTYIELIEPWWVFTSVVLVTKGTKRRCLEENVLRKKLKQICRRPGAYGQSTLKLFSTFFFLKPFTGSCSTEKRQVFFQHELHKSKETFSIDTVSWVVVVYSSLIVIQSSAEGCLKRWVSVIFIFHEKKANMP